MKYVSIEGIDPNELMNSADRMMEASHFVGVLEGQRLQHAAKYLKKAARIIDEILAFRNMERE